MNAAAQAPKLLKARIRHSRWFVLALVPFILFSTPYITPETALNEGLEWLGICCIAICALGRGFCSLFIGGRKNDELVMHGVFSVVRNPLYVFSFIGTVGIGLMSGMLSFLFMLALVFAAYYRAVIQKEEAFLLNKFGDHYRQYMRHVPRWIPKFSLWQSQETIETHPRFVLLTLRDTTGFFLAIPFFEFLHMMQADGIVPVFWTIF